jgi:hypothetical protein
MHLDRTLHRRLKVAAAQRDMTLTEYTIEALKRQLALDAGFQKSAAWQRKARAAADALDRFGRRIGPIGVPVTDLIREGRRR